MITINQAKELLRKELKDVQIISTGRYKDWHVFETKRPGNAIKIGGVEMELDPYWFVNSNNGEIEQYIRVYKPEIFNQIEWTGGQLYHHGIKGQKWGVRRFQEADGDWTEAGLKRRAEREGWGDESGKENKNQKSKFQLNLTDKQKKLIIAGTVAVGTALAIYGAHKIGQHIANKNSTDPILLDYAKNQGDFTKIFKKKENFDPSSMKDFNDDLKSVNNGMIGIFGMKGRSNNCTNCSLAYEMRRRGLDVKAQTLSKGRPIESFEAAYNGKMKLTKEFSEFYNRPSNLSSSKDLVEEILAQPKGSRGFVLYQGHINNYEVFDDGVHIVDAQVGQHFNLTKVFKDEIYDTPDTNNLLARSMQIPIGYMRSDNLAPSSEALNYITNNTKSSILRETINAPIASAVSATTGLATYAGLNLKEKVNHKSTNEKR